MTATCDTLCLFGATGDLAKRMLLPSLYGLDHDGLLPPDLKILCTSRSELDRAGFALLANEAIAQFVPPAIKSDAKVRSFIKRIDYTPIDVTTGKGFDTLARLASGSKDVAIFLSTAPALFEPTIAGLAKAGLSGSHVRMALEKPLGTDLASSREINDAVAAAYPEDRTFRIDHYLGKETVQNLIALRFGNVLFEPLWNSTHIDHVQISVAETVGLEGRAGYYDGSGALRDMVQNHMLQLLALVAMEPPAHFNATEVRDEKVKALRSLRRITEENVTTCTVRGHYTPGAIGGQPVRGYEDELGGPSDTETFVALKAHIDNWRWQGVPFYLRTGKRMPVRRSEIFVQFKPVPHSIFAARGAALEPNTLLIRLQPDETVRITMMAKKPGLDRSGIRLRQVPLDLGMADAFSDTRRRIAYERLLLDLLTGDPTLFVRRDEVEAQWEWIDGIRAAWDAKAMEPKKYAAGTWGPSAAIGLLERDGVSWHE